MDKNNSIGLTVAIHLIRIAIAGIVVFCLWTYIPKLLEYKKSDDAYKKIRDDSVEEAPAPQIKPIKPLSFGIETEAETEPETEKDSILHIDWEDFKDTDVIGWIQLDDISYPILQGDTNRTYLHALPDRSYNYGGSIFLYSRNSALFDDRTSFVYGHNMANGSMFGKLRNYTDKKYKDHAFYIYLPDGTRRTYRFFAVVSVPDGSYPYTWDFATDSEFMDWQKKLINDSFYKNSPEPSEDAKYILLSTCHGRSGTSQRLLVIGQFEKEEVTQEKASWYGGYLNKIYDRYHKDTEEKNESEE